MGLRACCWSGVLIGDEMPDKNTIDKENKLAVALEKTPSLSPDQANKLLIYLAACQLKAITRKEAIVSSLTLPNSVKQAGRKSKANEGAVITRPLRNDFSAERERQLMKRVATQFFFALQLHLKQNNINKKLVEVELMHATIGDKHFVFLAANEVDVATQYQALLDNSASTEALLTSIYQPDRDVEGKRRSKRYARKLKLQLFNGEVALKSSAQTADGDYAAAVAQAVTAAWAIQDMNARPSQRIEALLDEKPGGVFLLDFSRTVDKSRHAEEFLVDVANIIKVYADNKQLEVGFAIAGKKRPCATCSGRMMSVIDRFGERPGFLWKHAAGRQSPATFRRTAQTILENSSHVSLDGRGKKAPHYDTGSDSDEGRPEVRQR